MATTLEIIQGLNQAAANAYDGAHDARFVVGDTKELGLSREEGCPIIDSRVSDGFGVKFVGDMLQINYEANVPLSSVYAVGFEEECERKLQKIADFLKKEYKMITGKSISLSPQSEAKCVVQSTGRVRTFVMAHRFYKIGGMKDVTTLGEGVTDPLAVNYYKFLKEGSFVEGEKTLKEVEYMDLYKNCKKLKQLGKAIRDSENSFMEQFNGWDPSDLYDSIRNNDDHAQKGLAMSGSPNPWPWAKHIMEMMDKRDRLKEQLGSKCEETEITTKSFRAKTGL